MAVADRACELLRAHGTALGADAVEQMCAMAYFVGVFDVPDVTEETLRSQGFPIFVIVGARRVHGFDHDTWLSYHLRLLEDFPELKFVKGALQVAELEETATRPNSDRRRRKVWGEASVVRQLLQTVPVCGEAWVRLVDEVLTMPIG